MFDKAVRTYCSTIPFVPDRFKTREMCDKAVDTCPFVFDFVPDQYIIQELCDKIVSEDPFILKYIDKAVDSCLLVLKFVPDWFVTRKIIEKIDSVVFTNDYIVFGDLGSDFVTCFIKGIGLNSITLDNINFDDDHFDYCDPKTINHVGLMVWCNKTSNAKHLNKNDRQKTATCRMISNKSVELKLVLFL